MSDIGARIAAMTQTVNDLKSMHSRVAANQGSNRSWWATASFGLLYEATRRLTGVSSVNQGVAESLRITGQSISILEGSTRTERYGSLFDAASTNDEAMSFWLEYAQQTGETLAMALGLASYSVATFFGKVGGNLQAQAESVATGVGDSLPWIAVGLVAVVLILILK